MALGSAPGLILTMMAKRVKRAQRTTENCSADHDDDDDGDDSEIINITSEQHLHKQGWYA